MTLEELGCVTSFIFSTRHMYDLLGHLWIFMVGTSGIYGGWLWEDVLICRLWAYLLGYSLGARMADWVAMVVWAWYS